MKLNIAYSILLLAISNTREKKSFFDGFCGSGTFLVAAKLLGFVEIVAQDISRKAIDITRSRISSARVNLADSTKSKIIRQFDLLFSNLPWNKQVEMLSHTKLYTQIFDSYYNMTRDNGCFGFLLQKPEIMIKVSKKCNVQLLYNIEIGFLGQNPNIVIFKKL